MIHVDILLPSGSVFCTDMPDVPAPGARIEIMSEDYHCGQSYWFKLIRKDAHKDVSWLVRIKAYPIMPTKPTRSATLLAPAVDASEPVGPSDRPIPYRGPDRFA